MTYHSVGEIFAAIADTRARLEENVAGLNEAEQSFRPAPEAWTAAEIMEHLSIIEHQLVRLTEKMLRKAEAAGAASADGAAKAFAPFSLDEIIERSRREKYQAPEAARPGGDVPLAESLERLRRSRAALRELRPRLERADLTGMRYPHPAFGPLDAYTWLAFIGLHEERHLRQIQALKAAPEFQALRL